jgi:hypothetical protein
MAIIKIEDLDRARVQTTEPEVLAEQRTRQVKGGDNPGMAPPGAYEAGVSGNCEKAQTSMDSLCACLMYL